MKREREREGQVISLSDSCLLFSPAVFVCFFVSLFRQHSVDFLGRREKRAVELMRMPLLSSQGFFDSFTQRSDKSFLSIIDFHVSQCVSLPRHRNPRMLFFPWQRKKKKDVSLLLG